MIMLENVALPESFNLPVKMSDAERQADTALYEKAKEAILSNNALLIAHYYTDPLIQKLAEETGGFIGDSLEMARVGAESDKDLILVAGVRFMGETAKILSPEKTVVMPDLKAECSLDLCCTPEELERSIAEIRADASNGNVTVVAYANTSARVKALSDWIVTSSMAVDLADYLASRNERILWLPDRHLGSYIADRSGADVFCWPGRCIVHDSFDAAAIARQKELFPEAKVLVHPESSREVVALGDCVGSTSQLLDYVKKDDASAYIVATERGIFYKMSQACPDKKFIEAAVTSRKGADLEGCAKCPWMDLNSLALIIECFDPAKRASHEIFVDESVRVEALKPLQRMLKFAAAKKAGDLPRDL